MRTSGYQEHATVGDWSKIGLRSGMKSAIVTVLFVLPCVVPAQTVNGPGDDVLCGGYTPIHLFRASDLSTVNRRIPPPFPLFAETGNNSAIVPGGLPASSIVRKTL